MSVYYEMIAIRASLIEQYINKERSFKDLKEIMMKSTKTIRQWIAAYKKHGENGLYPKKSGPKGGSTPYNRTSAQVEGLVEQFARMYRFEGPINLSYRLSDLGHSLNQSTIYRILKRKGLRHHNHEYTQINRHTKRYVKEFPGDEIQVDASFPFGRSRKLIVYDGIDDCTRTVGSKCYLGYGIEQSIDFINHIIQIMPVHIKAIRTDCGREFGKAFTDHCNINGIIHIKNKPYTPQHNGKVERYHYTQQLYCTNFLPFTITLDEANYSLTQRSVYYNSCIRHTGLGMNGLTPIQKLMSTTKQIYEQKCQLNSTTTYDLSIYKNRC